MSMRILITDDEAPARARLRRMLEELDGCEIIGEAGNGHDTLRICEQQHPDILLLDIRMPGMDGIETARHLARLDDGPAVIFTTAYDHYAIEAFDAEAVAYLLKPVRRERLLRALHRAARLTRPQADAVASRQPDTPIRTTICARKATGLQLIPIGDIRYFRAEQKYVTANHLHGEDLLDEPLKDLETEFSDRFIRIHRSVLVAVAYLERMERNSAGQYEIYLRGCGEPLPVSRRHVAGVKLALRRPGR